MRTTALSTTFAAFLAGAVSTISPNDALTQENNTSQDQETPVLSLTMKVPECWNLTGSDMKLESHRVYGFHIAFPEYKGDNPSPEKLYNIARHVLTEFFARNNRMMEGNAAPDRIMNKEFWQGYGFIMRDNARAVAYKYDVNVMISIPGAKPVFDTQCDGEYNPGEIYSVHKAQAHTPAVTHTPGYTL